MANFQFGQDNVGSNWQVPSWYVQGMSQSPMAASIAGLGNSISAFTSGYQAAKQAERGYRLDQKQLGLSERQVKLQEDAAEYRQRLLEEQAAAAEAEKRKQERLRLQQLSLEGFFAGDKFDLGSGTTPATEPRKLGTPYAPEYFNLPKDQGAYPVMPSSLTGY